MAEYRDIECFFYKICKNKEEILFFNNEATIYYVYERTRIILCSGCEEALRNYYGVNWHYKEKSFGDKILELLGDDRLGKETLSDELVKDLNTNKKAVESKINNFHKKLLSIKKNKELEKQKARDKIVRANSKLKKSIIGLLKEKGIKMPASDIDAHLKSKNVDQIKFLCEKMYIDGEIGRSGNYRYFVLKE